MTAEPDTSICWFAGAMYNKDDQLPRFIREGIWETGIADKLAVQIRNMQPGQRIAIKAAYTRKKDLPFDNKGQSVSVMQIRATGTIVENPGDGRTVRVRWDDAAAPREWYFFTVRQTLWRVEPYDWTTQALIAFAFHGESQDLTRFQNAPFWKARFGTDAERFPWIPFYREFADRLLEFRQDRARLLGVIRKVAANVDNLEYLEDLTDICPFTMMGIFNRQMLHTKRTLIARELGALLGVAATVPTQFDGVPTLNNQNSWFFGPEDKRDAGDIEALWTVFARGLDLAKDESDATAALFVAAYDAAMEKKGVKWNLSMGLYWANPWTFPTLDGQSRQLLAKEFELDVTLKTQPCSGAEYLELKGALEQLFADNRQSVHSFPELSLQAWRQTDVAETNEVDSSLKAVEAAEVGHMRYGVQDIVADGCFVAPAEIERMLGRLRIKKNLILQGPPGTGKTWLAKRLAFALIGRKAEGNVRVVQFHPTLSYEDFVRGWRPSGEGKLTLVDGVFMEAVQAALASPQEPIVVLIEEINRGNPAQIFGELLTLLEAGKRSAEHAVELCYPDATGARSKLYLPENLYVVGTMNVADRSLALVDMALRRRFAFVDLAPQLNDAWRTWVMERGGLDAETVARIRSGMVALNEQIASDLRLGSQFCIGHSFVTPTEPVLAGQSDAWFQAVVETEIGPLLETYWFDEPKNAKKAAAELIKAWR